MADTATAVLEDDLIEPVTPPAPATGPGSIPPPAEWRVDRQEREYIPRPAGKSGIIYRKGNETTLEAVERDAKPKDGRPRRKTKTPKMPPAPKQVDLRELEAALADALKSPAAICMMYGDEWAADHFMKSGPYLARNLILAIEHNPWLRRKLEEAATGQDAAMKLVTLAGCAGGLVMYLVPPVIYFLNLPAPDKTRKMMGIPPRKEPADAPVSTPAPFPSAA